LVDEIDIRRAAAACVVGGEVLGRLVVVRDVDAFDAKVVVAARGEVGRLEMDHSVTETGTTPRPHLLDALQVSLGQHLDRGHGGLAFAAIVIHRHPGDEIAAAEGHVEGAVRVSTIPAGAKQARDL
jgi:hypothetical protein